MCSSTSPKMFAASAPMGTGGDASMPISYASSPQPTSDAGAVAPNMPSTPQPPAPGQTQPKPIQPTYGSGTPGSNPTSPYRFSPLMQMRGY